MTKRTRRGELMAYYVANVDRQTDDCIEWPYALCVGGYGRVRADGKKRLVHILACERHHGPRPEGMEVRHLCGKASCFNGAHLRWGTKLENAADRLVHGTDLRGEQHPSAKLTESEVLEIRRRFAEGGVTRQALADEYGVTPRTIGYIISRRIWRHI